MQAASLSAMVKPLILPELPVLWPIVIPAGSPARILLLPVEVSMRVEHMKRVCSALSREPSWIFFSR